MAVNKNWEDEFNHNDYADHKEAYVEWDRLRQQNSTVGWIYIGVDIKRRGEVKIGKTAGELGTRASGSQNPYYTLFHAFKIREGVDPHKIEEIEDAVLKMLEKDYQRINHYGSDLPSEWFKAKPSDARELMPSDVKELVQKFLYDRYNLYMYSYHCHERDMGIINSWQNNRLINGGRASPYQANDLSNPPIAFECQMPPGCGADCDCW